MLSYIKRQKIIKKIILFAVIVGGVLGLALPASPTQVVAADDIDICSIGGGCVGNLDGADDLSGGDSMSRIIEVINFVANFLIYLVAGISVLYIILGAWFIISGLGDGPTYEKGLKTLKNAVLGLILALLARELVQFVVALIEDAKN